MFDNEFYPTPDCVIEKMIEPFRNELHNKFILEPSAGKGNILDYLFKERDFEYNGNVESWKGRMMTHKVPMKNKVYCIEQNPELVFILQEKGYKVLGNDFFDYTPQYAIDLVIMNPPFSNGDEHLLHAWETLDSGDIVCLLNAETINNTYTHARELLVKIIQDHGTVEMLGDCFKTAERKTSVNVAMVRLHKESKGNFNFDFNPIDEERHADFTDEIQTGNQIALDDKLGAYLRIYDKSKEAFAEYIKAKAKFEYYATGFLESSSVDSLVKNAMKVGNGDKRATYNAFIDELKIKAWTSILGKVGIEKYMTNNVQKNFDKFKAMQGASDLTRVNVMQLVQFICGSSGQILNQAVIDVFDIFTQYYKENRCYVEGWKTNSAWKVNRKIILPGFIKCDYGKHYSTNSYNWQKYSDIERAMCFLTGKRWDDFKEVVGEYSYNTPEREKKYKMESLSHAISRVEIGDSSMHECEFFTFRCYKKGTLHIWFKDEALWARFNQVACDGKFALGGDF